MKRHILLLLTLTFIFSCKSAKEDLTYYDAPTSQRNQQSQPSSELKADKISFFYYWIEDHDSTVFILVSLHIGREDFYPLPDYIEAAFERSSYLVVEMNILSRNLPYNSVGIILNAILEDGQTIDTLISEDLFEKLIDTLNTFQKSPEANIRYKPWFLANMIKTLPYSTLGYSSKFGIDFHFLEAAGTQKKILELETFDFQLNMIMGLNSVGYLDYTLSFLNVEYAREYIDTYLSGDEDRMLKLIFNDEFKAIQDYQYFYDEIYYNRNIRMTDSINLPIIQDTVINPKLAPAIK